MVDSLSPAIHQPLGHHQPLGTPSLGILNLAYFFPAGLPDIEPIEDDSNQSSEQSLIAQQVASIQTVQLSPQDSVSEVVQQDSVPEVVQPLALEDSDIKVVHPFLPQDSDAKSVQPFTFNPSSTDASVSIRQSEQYSSLRGSSSESDESPQQQIPAKSINHISLSQDADLGVSRDSLPNRLTQNLITRKDVAFLDQDTPEELTNSEAKAENLTRDNKLIVQGDLSLEQTSSVSLPASNLTSDNDYLFQSSSLDTDVFNQSNLGQLLTPKNEKNQHSDSLKSSASTDSNMASAMSEIANLESTNLITGEASSTYDFPAEISDSDATKFPPNSSPSIQPKTAPNEPSSNSLNVTNTPSIPSTNPGTKPSAIANHDLLPIIVDFSVPPAPLQRRSISNPSDFSDHQEAIEEGNTKKPVESESSTEDFASDDLISEINKAAQVSAADNSRDELPAPINFNDSQLSTPSFSSHSTASGEEQLRNQSHLQRKDRVDFNVTGSKSMTTPESLISANLQNSSQSEPDPEIDVNTTLLKDSSNLPSLQKNSLEDPVKNRKNTLSDLSSEVDISTETKILESLPNHNLEHSAPFSVIHSLPPNLQDISTSIQSSNVVPSFQGTVLNLPSPNYANSTLDSFSSSVNSLFRENVVDSGALSKQTSVFPIQASLVQKDDALSHHSIQMDEASFASSHYAYLEAKSDNYHLIINPLNMIGDSSLLKKPDLEYSENFASTNQLPSFNIETQGESLERDSSSIIFSVIDNAAQGIPRLQRDSLTEDILSNQHRDESITVIPQEDQNPSERHRTAIENAKFSSDASENSLSSYGALPVVVDFSASPEPLQRQTTLSPSNLLSQDYLTDSASSHDLTNLSDMKSEISESSSTELISNSLDNSKEAISEAKSPTMLNSGLSLSESSTSLPLQSLADVNVSSRSQSNYRKIEESAVQPITRSAYLDTWIESNNTSDLDDWQDIGQGNPLSLNRQVESHNLVSQDFSSNSLSTLHQEIISDSFESLLDSSPHPSFINTEEQSTSDTQTQKSNSAQNFNNTLSTSSENSETIPPSNNLNTPVLQRSAEESTANTQEYDTEEKLTSDTQTQKPNPAQGFHNTLSTSSENFEIIASNNALSTPILQRSVEESTANTQKYDVDDLASKLDLSSTSQSIRNLLEIEDVAGEMTSISHSTHQNSTAPLTDQRSSSIEEISDLDVVDGVQNVSSLQKRQNLDHSYLDSAPEPTSNLIDHPPKVVNLEDDFINHEENQSDIMPNPFLRQTTLSPNIKSTFLPTIEKSETSIFSSGINDLDSSTIDDPLPSTIAASQDPSSSDALLQAKTTSNEDVQKASEYPLVIRENSLKTEMNLVDSTDWLEDNSGKDDSTSTVDTALISGSNSQKLDSNDSSTVTVSQHNQDFSNSVFSEIADSKAREKLPESTTSDPELSSSNKDLNNSISRKLDSRENTSSFLSLDLGSHAFDFEVRSDVQKSSDDDLLKASQDFVRSPEIDTSIEPQVVIPEKDENPLEIKTSPDKNKTVLGRIQRDVAIPEKDEKSSAFKTSIGNEPVSEKAQGNNSLNFSSSIISEQMFSGQEHRLENIQKKSDDGLTFMGNDDSDHLSIHGVALDTNQLLSETIQKNDNRVLEDPNNLSPFFSINPVNLAISPQTEVLSNKIAQRMSEDNSSVSSTGLLTSIEGGLNPQETLDLEYLSKFDTESAYLPSTAHRWVGDNDKN
ncbi:MAG: hypothetical protein VKI82_13635, partial [Leptolyngbya sp.]|nr:hypothetical protein [Leptolyngbya sp.]